MSKRERQPIVPRHAVVGPASDPLQVGCLLADGFQVAPVMLVDPEGMRVQGLRELLVSVWDPRSTLVDVRLVGTCNCDPVAAGAVLVAEEVRLAGVPATMVTGPVELLGRWAEGLADREAWTPMGEVGPDGVPSGRGVERDDPDHMRRCSDGASVLANYLRAHPGARTVRYPGLADDAGNAVARATLHHGFGRHVLLSPADGWRVDGACTLDGALALREMPWGDWLIGCADALGLAEIAEVEESLILRI